MLPSLILIQQPLQIYGDGTVAELDIQLAAPKLNNDITAPLSCVI